MIVLYVWAIVVAFVFLAIIVAYHQGGWWHK